ncbi:MAG: ABC transporter ATP-binding protein [Treponema sp.]|nr:ABC transporter ATP-binding protein [Treponema sp.]
MTVISVKNVAKKFLIYHDRAVTLKEKLLFKKRNHYEKRWVLNDISFEARKGEAIGIIGQNGCGKSTMLKLMTKIMYPDKGSIEIKGRISSLIELGAGFHPDMSGRENIYTNASIFGLTHKEIEERVEKIIDFSEIREFIDNPVRTYSSGMYTRLAFSVAIHVDADVLLVDEILAVGDASFQAKCFNKMREIKANGMTIVIVSHGLGEIEMLCERSIWIDDGLIQNQGSPFDVHPLYLNFMGQKTHIAEQQKIDNTFNANNDDEKEAPLSASNKRSGKKDIEISSVLLLDKTDKENDIFETGSFTRVKINYKINKPVIKPIFKISIFRNDGLQCYSTSTLTDRVDIPELTANGIIYFKIENNSLISGVYLIDAAIISEDDFIFDSVRNVQTFKMYSALKDSGVNRLEHIWELE